MDNKPKILITGAHGRLGRAITKKLSDKYTIIAIDNEPEQEIDQKNYFQIDIGNEKNVKEKLKQIKQEFGNDFASVIHLAAYYSFGDQEWEKYKKITINGTKNLFTYLRDEFAIDQFIFSSTLLVYMPCEIGEKITEGSPIRPAWEYPKSKVITENILFELNEHIPLVILRIAGCYDNNCHSIPIANQIKMSYEKDFRRHLFPGNFKHGSPYLHLKDLAEAIFILIEKRKTLPHEVTLNLGESKTYSHEMIQNRLELLINKKELTIYPIPKIIAKAVTWFENRIPFYPTPFVKPWMIDIADDHYELDMTLAKSLIDWNPTFDLYNTLPMMIENLKKDSSEWYKEQKLVKRGAEIR